MKQIRRFLALFFIPILFHFYSHADLSNIQPGQSIWCISKEIGSVLDVLSAKIPDTSTLDVEVSLLVETICSKIEIVQNADIVAQSLLCDAISTIDEIELCMSITVTGPTTITEPGLYCVSVNFSGNVVIDANEVTLDINNHVITGAVEILSDQSNVIIQNGVVDNDNLLGNAIVANSGTSNITLRDVTTKNAQIGINFEGVTGGTIANCSMVQNITGLELDQSHKIVIDNCTADCNVNAGYCLISSTTNIIQNCKAISTGEGNTQTFDQTIFGFVTSNGFGNIFERCIANATQALSTTDSQSLVAGFALRGSEGCSKIIESESSNTQTSVSGFTIPYGILLEAQRTDPITTVTAASPIADLDADINKVDWSPDGKYLVAGGVFSGTNDVSIFEFDRVNSNLKETPIAISGIVNAVAWSPDGNYVAIGTNGTGNDFRVYEFDRTTNSLINEISGGFSGTVNTIGWSPDSSYLAIGTIPPLGQSNVIVYEFDRIANLLTSVDSLSIGAITWSLDWSPDGDYLALGGVFSGFDFRVYEFDRVSKILINETTAPIGNVVLSVEWSFDGKYVAVGGALTGDDLRVYEFNRASNSLINEASISVGGTVNAVSWSPDGRYLGAGIATGLLIYDFDRSTNSLTDVISFAVSTINWISWSPDGGYMALALDSGDNNFDLYICDVLTFPSKNVITNNTVYCNSGAQTPSGIGISGSSISNLIIGNTAYNNPQNPFMVPTNYAFVTNVFNPLFGSEPTALQNISIGGCDTIVQSDDQALLIKQVTQQIILADTILDVIESKLAELISQQDILAPCSAILVTGSTTISQQGIYCVAQPFTGSVTINASDVELRLNNYTITGDVQIGAFNNVVVRGGTIDNNNALGNALGVSSGATNINVDEVTVKNALAGINFEGVTGGTITNCSMVQNATAIELEQSHKITIDNCIADCNVNVGYCLVSSTTNIIQNCKALSTGEGNTDTSAVNIFGFVSAGGYGNIFDNCISNGTQALMNQDFDSNIAGFALRADSNDIFEQCSQIINCEAGNTQTNAGSEARPYGIWLEQKIVDTTLTLTYFEQRTGFNTYFTRWSPDSAYFAEGGTNDILNIYKVSRDPFNLTCVISFSPGFGDVQDFAWHPNGRFVAIGFDSTSNPLHIYEFDRVHNTLTRFAVPDVDVNDISSVHWRNDGLYLVAIEQDTPFRLIVFKFNPVTKQLSFVSSVDGAGEANPTALSRCRWNPDGVHILTSKNSGSPTRRLYTFENNILNFVFGSDFSAVSGRNSNWSPDGIFASDSRDRSVLRLNRLNNTLTEITPVGPGDSFSSAWSSDGQYISQGNLVNRFNRTTNTLTTVGNFDVTITGNILDTEWSPDGQYLAIGTRSTTTPLVGFGIYEALHSCKKNIIKNNIVYCNSGTQEPSGIGIVGNSVLNLIINNTAYSNPIAPPAGVETNYAFVTNVFNPLFQAEPTALQNISIGGCDQIPAPDNTLLLAQQVKGLSTQTKSIIDILEVYADDIIEALFPPCRPVHIISPTTITASGIYCLGNPITGSIAINASDVQLDLSTYAVTGDISVQTGEQNITIKNGVIDNNNQSSDALLVNSGTSNVNVDNLLVRNAQVGINFDGVTGGTISNCSMVQNVTGVQLDTSYKIIIDNCVASCNRNIGYSLSSSSANIIQDCKALSTGEGNNETLEQTVAGFISTNGSANIFERCIANATQALSTIDSDSLVAGFALQGFENCTKIINSESANTQTSANGFTIPVGILLVDLQTIINISGLSPWGIAWSPDSAYVAAGITSSTEVLRVYTFDRVSNTVTAPTDLTVGVAGDQVFDVSWASNGDYIAIARDSSGVVIDSFELQLIKFDQVTNTLTFLQGFDFGVGAGDQQKAAYSVDWTPDGEFLVVGANNNAISNTYEVGLYSFDFVTELLTGELFIDHGESIRSVRWSPDGQFLAIGGNGGTGGAEVRIYDFDAGTPTLTEIETITNISTVYSVRWSEDGAYLAVFGESVTTPVGTGTTRVYSFDGTNLTEEAVAGTSVPSTIQVDGKLDWSPDGRYLAITQGNSSIILYEYDRSSQQLIEVDSITTSNLRGFKWSPDGGYLWISQSNQLTLISVLGFPAKNVIVNNTVYCTSGAGGGVGIAGNDVANLIIQNTVYNNPINLQLGSNVDQIISTIDSPTLLQNIAIVGCDAIAQPVDPALLAAQIKAKECNSLTLLDEIESKLDLILSDTNRAPCFPITITASQLPTTITSSGVYCLAENAPVHVGNIRINADDVELLLNNRTLQGSITVNGANARIIEGVIDANGASAGISANSGADNILVSNVRVQDAIVGIALNGMSGGTVEHCTLSQNYTGLLLNSAHKINVDSCIADCNLNVGFDLINSTTNFFIDCKAISTGQGNNGQFVQTIVGFMSENGSANIFEKCIANDTHGSQVADEASWVAGFLLQGNEQCSKIINCESANTFAGIVLTDTNIAPLAVPQGISLEIELLEESLALLDQENSGGSVTTGSFMHNAWSPDNEYVAVAYNSSTNGGLFVYKFDKATGLLTKTVGTNNPFLGVSSAYTVRWSPNGKYIILGKTGTLDQFTSFEFNRATNALSLKNGVNGSSLGLAFRFSSTGAYGFAGGLSAIRSYLFNQSTGLIGTQIDTYSPGGNTDMIDLSPDNRFLLRGGSGASSLIILPVNGDGTFNVSELLGVSVAGGEVIDVAWHPSGHYLAAATFADKKVRIYAFNDNFPLSITSVGTAVDFNINSGGFSWYNKQIAWSSRGDFLVVTLNNTNVRVYSFDFDTGQLTTAQNFDTSTGPLALNRVGSVAWSSNDKYISISNGYPVVGSPAIEGLTITNSGYVEPQKNIIMRNTVYCTSGGGGGIGIYGNNVANLIIQNTIYNNPIGMQVGSNLDEIISSIDSPAPTVLQNIVIPGCDAIAQPIDIPLLVSQLKPKLLDAVSSVELFATAVDDFLSAVDELVSGCGPTVITFAPTTINMPGIYCLSQTVTGNIYIDASNVELDLNTSAVNGSVLVNGGENVLIKNGIVDNNNAEGIALNVNGGAQNVSVLNVVAKNAAVGINFDDVTGGVISRCSITQNSTGLQLEYSHKIDIRNCTAIGNSIRGFSLISSTTNVVNNCKALNTGFGNMQTFNNSVFGFVCENGSGNILEDCIANATQALTTTDFVSQIAGIAFLGTEECGKIIGCEAGNAKVAPNGFSIPRGILLQSRFEDETLTLTATPAIPDITDRILSVDWSPDSKFLLLGVGLTGAPEIQIYAYDYIQNRITLSASAPLNGVAAGNVEFMGSRWDPSGKFIAVTVKTTIPDASQCQVYSFSSTTNTIEFIANTSRSIPVASQFNTIPDWNPSGQFIAYGIENTSPANGTVAVDAFDPIAKTLTSFAQISTPPATSGNTVPKYALWHPNGTFIAAGIVGQVVAVPVRQGAVALYQITGSSLIDLGFDTWNDNNAHNPGGGDWSPDGGYFVTVDDAQDTAVIFNFINDSINRVFQGGISQDIPSDPFDVKWSSDGNYFATGGEFASGQEGVRAFFFDRVNNEISTVADSNIGSSVTNPQLFSLSWSIDGGHIAVGVKAAGISTAGELLIYEALKFPQKNVIKNNTIYCNSGGIGPSGVGLSGSSIANLILNNVSYANPVAENVLFDTNYSFVTNVFNPNFSNTPNDLQNLSIGGCQPLRFPVDLSALVKGVNSAVDALRPTITELESKIDMLMLPDPDACLPIGIAGSSVPTTISVSGIYCLAQTSTGDITITADDVELRMNNQRLTGSIIVSGANARISEGLIDANGASAGISASSTADGILLSKLRVHNAIVGIQLDGVSGGVVEYCTLSQNTTGVQLNSAHKITIDECRAQCNLNAGFDLINSTTNILQDCKALSTGEGNTNRTNQTVFGFVSANGNGNIFERCIANSTQALSTTDVQSLVAGFALRGTEGCSKIIECESANAQTSADGFTVPMGILLEETVNLQNVIQIDTQNRWGMAWSPDGKYFITSEIESSSIIKLYEFDRINNKAITIAEFDINEQAFDIAWSPGGDYIAIARDSYVLSDPEFELMLFKFNRSTNKLSFLQGINFGSDGGSQTFAAFSVDWTPDGKFLAASGANNSIPTNREVALYSFDVFTERLTQIQLIDHGQTVTSVRWSPDGKFLAIGGGAGTGSAEVRLYRFNTVAQTLTEIATITNISTVYGVRWSADGKYLAVYSNSVTTPVGTGTTRIYSFDAINLTEEAVTGTSLPSILFVDAKIAWSPDGHYLAITQGNTLIIVYEYDRSNKQFIEVDRITTSDLRGFKWSPDGGYLLSAKNNNQLISVLDFPSKNVIVNNTVYCNSGGSIPSGIGISGSSIANMIIGNTSYNNPEDPFMVAQNYAFCTNVFNPLFQNEPTTLQNISIAGCDAIAMPADLALLTEQFTAEVCSVIDSAIMQSIFDVVADITPTYTPVCVSTAITTVPTTINFAGTYCLAQTSTGDITINASDVSLNLNNHILNGAVLADGQDQLLIRNGTINATGISGIFILNGADITTQDVAISNALVGIAYQNISGGFIKNCTLTQNSTGVQLQDSHKIIIDSCTASCNTNAGFDLVNSTTNVILNSKALSTGEGNTNLTDQTIFGFVSSDGYGNIFERCIANATQALSTTDSQSLVAGFALRGDEGCTKIINCESGNTQTDVSGFTIPYGILLENSIGSEITLTAVPSIPDPTETVIGVAWHPTGKYIATTIFETDPELIRIYELDRQNYMLQQVATPASIPNAPAESVAWHPSGNYLATGHYKNDAATASDDAFVIRIYNFDQTNNSLTQVTGPNIIPDETAKALSWRSDGRYLVSGFRNGDTHRLRVYSFDSVSETLTQVATPAVALPAATVLTVDWIPGGNYIAIGLSSGSDRLRIFQFEESSNTLSQFVLPNVGPTGSARKVKWSPDGRYLALADTSNDRLAVYQFDPAAVSLTKVAGFTQTPQGGSVDWSADGQYIVYGNRGDSNTSDGEILVFLFDRGSNQLTLKATPDIALPSSNGGGIGTMANFVISPDGGFIAGGRYADGAGTSFFVYETLNFPHKNVIANNTVYCNSGAQTPLGFGISGSSIQNMIIGNTAYNNPQSPFMVPTNYAFVTNVYNPLFELSPTVIQNISLGGCVPIAQQENLALLINQIDYKVDQLFGCQPTSITSANISSGTISLTTAGSYCLATDLTANMVIAADCIAVDLNERTLTGLVTVQTADQVTVQNGRVSAPAPTSSSEANRAAVGVASTATNVQIKNVIIRCADTTTDGVHGRSGVVVQGNNVQVADCSILSGAGANSTGSPAGSGGFGIVVNSTAQKTLLQNNAIITGMGGVSSAASGMGGDGGIGICVVASAQDTSIIGCTVLQTGGGGSAVDTMAGTGGLGGDGIAIADANKTLVTNCIVRNAGLAGQPLPLKDLPGGIEMIFHGRALTDLLAPGVGTPGSIAHGTTSYNITNLQPIIFQSLVDDLNQESAWPLAPNGNMIEPILDGMGMQIGQQLVGVGDFSNVVLQGEPQPSPQDQITAAQNAGQIISSGAKIGEGTFVARATAIVPN